MEGYAFKLCMVMKLRPFAALVFWTLPSLGKGSRTTEIVSKKHKYLNFYPSHGLTGMGNE